MPFTIKKNNKGKFCVHKKDADGNPMGDAIGKCHEIKKDATAQIGAIESELKRKGKKSSETDLSDTKTTHDAADKKKVRPEVGGGVDVDKLKDSDFALPKERKFPVSIPKDVGDAVSSWGRYKGKTSFATFKKNLTALAKRKGKKFVAALPKEWKDKMGTNKAESIDAYRYMIEDAWSTPEHNDLYVSEVFDEFVIVHNWKQKFYFQVAYSVDGESVEFVKQNEWVEVKLKKEWVEKSLNLRDRLNFEDYILDDDEEGLDQDPEPSTINSGFAIKSLGGNRVGGYAVLWGDDESKDLDEEYFTSDTKDLTAVFDEIGTIPFMVHHAADEKVVKFVGGAVDVLELDDIGVWWEAKTKEFEAYKKYVSPMMEKGMAFTSSGTFPRAKRTEKNGFISRWPIAEISATWLPAEYRMLEHPISEVKSAYEKLGIEVDLSNYEDKPKDTDKNQGVEKARLQELVKQELINVGLLQLEIGE